MYIICKEYLDLLITLNLWTIAVIAAKHTKSVLGGAQTVEVERKRKASKPVGGFNKSTTEGKYLEIDLLLLE